MKLVWSPERASQAYIETVKSCAILGDFGVPELLSAMAAGWNSKLIVETWSSNTPIATSLGLAIAAVQTSATHICIVPDERSRSDYIKAMKDAAISPQFRTVQIGHAESALAKTDGVDFLVVDCKSNDFASVLRFARLSERGAVLVCKNAGERIGLGFRWQKVLQRGTRVVKSVYLPVGRGLEIAHVGSAGGSSTVNGGRWIGRIDRRSGEEHVFRR